MPEGGDRRTLNQLPENIAVYAAYFDEFVTECPFCGSNVVIRESIYDIPDIGKVLLSSRTCSKCGYRHTDVIPLEARKHVRLYYKVDSMDDLYAHVIRSNVASIEIPELGFALDPGIAAQMMVTNIEGILQLIVEAAKSFEALGMDASNYREFVAKVAEQGDSFTLIMDDPLGLSSIKPPKPVPGKLLVERVEGDLQYP